jgi:hypothetical protein
MILRMIYFLTEKNSITGAFRSAYYKAIQIKVAVPHFLMPCEANPAS